jgi:hypothetical protein
MGNFSYKFLAIPTPPPHLHPLQSFFAARTSMTQARSGPLAAPFRLARLRKKGGVTQYGAALKEGLTPAGRPIVA